MNSRYIHRLSAACVLAALICTCLWSDSRIASELPKPQPVDGKITWVYDYAEGQQLSKQTGKPMFVVFRCER